MSISGRYSRLFALKEYGINADFSILKKKSIVICGVGGIGSLSAEMLVRCGIGRIAIIDFDTVNEENLNRLFYKNQHIGQFKAKVCAEILKEINQDVAVDYYQEDIMEADFELKLDQIFQNADVILNGLDNIPARQYLNVKCVTLNKPLMDAGALRSGLGGYIHLILPHQNACYQCTGSVQIQFKQNDVTGPQCAASLPSTIGIISSLQTQQVLKFLLDFGVNADFISFSSLTDEFIKLTLPRDPECYVCGIGVLSDSDKQKLTNSDKQDNLDDLLDQIEDQEQAISNKDKKTSNQKP